MSNFAIRAETVSKLYHIQRKQQYKMLRERIQDTFASGLNKLATFSFGGHKHASENAVWALNKVSFEIKHGESVGIIGANGAGKTTLLKILARVTAPTEGKIRLRGRVGSLLEVGTGFHPELSGRDNVYLNGAVLGMRKNEIDRKFDEIVDFSGVEEFIDTPVKHYSSGMRMRLAFSVAAHLEPEILLIDEVLAVGDIAFQNKSLNRMEKVVNDGRTILFVSHNLAAVKSICPQAILLEHGSLKFMGNTDTAVQMYLHENETISKSELPVDPGKSAQILSVTAYTAAGARAQTLPHDAPIHVRIKVYINTVALKTHLALKIFDANLEPLLVTHDFEPNGDFLIPRDRGVHEFQVQIPANFLTPGKYYLGSQIAAQIGKKIRVFDKLEHVSQFEVYDNGSLFSQLGIPWQGQIHNPDIKWTRPKQ